MLNRIIGTAAAALTALVPLVASADNAADWPKYHRTDDGWRYSPLDQINADTIKDLKVAWIHQPGDIQHGLQATPIVVDGIVYYVGPNNNVYAVNGTTGRNHLALSARSGPDRAPGVLPGRLARGDGRPWQGLSGLA